MKKIYEIIDTAFTKTMAIEALNTLMIFGNITEAEYNKGRVLIKKEFN